MLTVIVPHGHPDFFTNVLANFRRQRGVEARLLVVANGPAAESADPDASFEGRGLLKSIPPLGETSVDAQGITILRSGNHQSDAMNTGLAWLRANGGGAWARFDNDDYYGPDYLTAVERSLSGDGVVVSGMPWRFVMLDDGLHRFQGDGEFTGGSHACNTADVAEFPRMLGEDLEWCRTMRDRGARFVERESWGFCYDRSTRPAPRAAWGGPVVTRRAFGPSLFYGPQPLSAVDLRELEPLCAMPVPSNAEIFAEMSSL